MFRKTYSVVFQGVAVTAQQDLFSLLPATQKPIALLGLNLDQSSDVGDAAEEMLRYAVIRGHTTVGSGGTAPTARPLSPNYGAAAASARVNDTTIASAGTALQMAAGAFNIRTGLEKWWTPETWIASASADFLVVRLLTTPTDSLTMDGTLYFGEF